MNPSGLLGSLGQTGGRAVGLADSYLGFSTAVTDSRDVVLMYHSVGDPELYGNVSVERFRRDLEHVVERYEVVDLPEVLGRSDAKRVAITFDDGYRNVYTEALPVLREFEAPATVFITPGLLDGRNAELLWRFRESPTEPGYDNDERRETPPFADPGLLMLTDRQVRALVDDPLVTIGNHTRSHPDLESVLTVDRLSREIEGAKQELENRFDITVDRFSYPYGRVTDAAEAVVRNSHELAVTTATAPVPDPPDRYRIPRIPAQFPEWRLHWEVTDLRWRLSTLD